MTKFIMINLTIQIVRVLRFSVAEFLIAICRKSLFVGGYKKGE